MTARHNGSLVTRLRRWHLRFSFWALRLAVAVLATSACAEAKRSADYGAITESLSSWGNDPFSLSQFTLTFDAVPSQNLADVVIGLSQGAAAAYTDLAAIVRFNGSGAIDVRNGSDYGAQANVSYAAGKSYHFQMTVSVPSHTYTVYVTPAGGTATLLAQNYAFRTEQASVTSLGNLSKGAAVGDATVSKITISIGLADLPGSSASSTSDAGPTPDSGGGSDGSVSQPKPNAPTISYLRSVSAVQPFWNIANNGSTYSNNLNVFGASNYASATISVYLGGVLQGTTQSDGSGNWVFPLGIQSIDQAYVLNAAVAINGTTSGLSGNFNFWITSPISGFTTTPSSQMFVDGLPIETYVSSSSYTIANPDSHTLRFEVHQGDRWGGEGTYLERSELGAGYTGTQMPDKSVQHLTFELMWESGPANAARGWFINWQCHNDDYTAGTATSPFISIGLSGASNTQSAGDHFYVQSRWWNSSKGALSQNTITVLDQYIAPSNITRGVWHTVEMEALPNNAGGGYLKVWFDGAQVVNYSGNLGYGFKSYEEFGIYRSTTTENQAIRYRNYNMVATNGP